MFYRIFDGIFIYEEEAKGGCCLLYTSDAADD